MMTFRQVSGWMLLLNCYLFVSLPVYAAPVTGGKPVAGELISEGDAVALRGDGSDESAKLQRLLNRRGTIALPEGTFTVGDLVIYGGTQLIGAPGKTILKQRHGVMYLLSANPERGGTPNSADNEKNIRIAGIEFVGRVVEEGFSEHEHLLNLNAVSDVMVENCTFKGFRGDGIYLGSSNVARVERHNENVTIRNCLFDGINRNNRHGIFVLDGTGVYIENNRFINCTRFGDPGYMPGSAFDIMNPYAGPSMPGPLDLEPDGYEFAILRDIVVSGNRFSNSNGASGTICLYLPLKTFKVPPKGILITNNFIDATNRSIGINIFSAGNATPATADMDIIVSGNTVLNTWSGIEIKGVKGVKITGNRFENTGSSPIIGYAGAHKNVDLSFEGNTFKNISTETSVGLAIFSNDRLSIRNNKFIDVHGSVLTFQAGAASTNLTIDGNEVSSPARKTTYGFRNNGHEFNKATNVVRNNVFSDGIAGNDVPAIN